MGSLSRLTQAADLMHQQKQTRAAEEELDLQRALLQEQRATNTLLAQLLVEIRATK